MDGSFVSYRRSLKQDEQCKLFYVNGSYLQIIFLVFFLLLAN